MLRCIAIDDEPLALDLLVDNIARVPYLELTAACHDALEASALLQQQEADLVFLDIQMPGLTGLQFIKSLAQPPMFILVTAYEKYALEGFSLDVVDYLVKPVAFERFLKACGKAEALHRLRSGAPEKKEASHFFVSVDYSQLKIVFSDLMWIEGLKDYVKIHLKDASPVVVRMSMKSLEELLPQDRFVRIHKSYIVSKAYITVVRKTSVMLGTTELPIGESYREVLDGLTRG